MYLCRDYFKANVYTIWVHGPLRLGRGFKGLGSTSIVRSKTLADNRNEIKMKHSTRNFSEPETCDWHNSYARSV